MHVKGIENNNNTIINENSTILNEYYQGIGSRELVTDMNSFDLNNTTESIEAANCY